FDQELLRQNILELLASNLPPPPEDGARADDAEAIQTDEESHQDLSETFRFEVLPRLITPDFIHTISHALKACETRLRLMGHREKAEVALVARSLFELADPHSLAFHPLVLKICARTLEQTLGHPQSIQDAHGTVQSVLSDVLKLSQSEEAVDTQPAEELEDDVVDSASHQDRPHQAEEQVHDTDLPAEVNEAESDKPFPAISPGDLPAKALYKNFQGLETRNGIEIGDEYRVVKATDQRIEFVHTDEPRYLTLTADRLLLQCPSKPQLEVAMKEVETRCGKSLCYLAKTVDEG
ncbi:MAG: hypothetical protein O7E52_06225, partial [Candidatus Poribacteria bacterium]|nr:hypothetical protein [Candidatus Poribacteria bacterium]